MCDTCGCGQPSDHSHDHRHDTKLVELHEDIMSKNEIYALENRKYFDENQIFALNFVSSPGSGKTTILEKTITACKDNFPIAVIEGDQQTELDAERIRHAGAQAIQINTGAGCHLDAHQIGHAIQDLEILQHSALFIENVGNLVCPALFNLGEHHKILILSVTEGDDKPLKYPHMFHESDIVIYNKIDLLPYVDFDMEKSKEFALRLNPNMQFLKISARTGAGMDSWIDWLKNNLL
ncbi:MAG: hydrogenase nickel incorporation protein HypB [Candidatus Marinimicrobia bacterium]|nr:hydrogenase nickel incorporation protein HypB [Candidatus Neomarinimicrobiota bacterium]